jgi:hypothetical protein
MRWKKVTSNFGDSRLVSEFLFFPKNLNGETRWLEFAKIRQVYRYGMGWGGYWEDKAWHNEGDEVPR